MVKIVFYGPLSDVMGRVRSMELGSGPATVGTLIDRLSEGEAEFCSALARMPVKFAVNDAISPPDAIVKDGDEIAILPPFSGG